MMTTSFNKDGEVGMTNEDAVQWTTLKGNPPEPYVDVLIKFPSNLAVGFIDRDNVWSVYGGGGWYTEVANNDEQPIAWRALNE